MPEVGEAKPTTPTETPAPETPAAPEVPQKLGIFDPDPEEAAPAEGAPADPAKPADPPPAPPEPATPPENKPDPVGPKLAKLMRKEAEVRTAEQALKRREEELSRKEALLQSDDVLERLKAVGLNYEQITEHIALGKKVPTAAPESKDMADLKKKVSEMEAATAQREQAQLERNADNFRTEVRGFIEKGGEEFEYIRALGEEDTVFAVIDSHAKKTSEWLGGSREEALRLAATQVEKYLEEKREQPLLTTKKFQNRINASSAARPPATSATKPPPKTLSNSQAAAVPPRAPVEFTTVDETLARLSKQGLKLFDE